MDYGLPARVETDTLVIASSYSGNTEETISAYEEARRQNLPLAALAVGGKLIAMAKRDGVPYVQMPNTGIQPRSALGFSLRALLALMGQEQLLAESARLEHSLDAEALQAGGEALAAKLAGRMPVIYASQRNYAVAYNWKIKFNETGKIPAFMNAVPELNHNEMTGFDVTDASRELSERFAFVLLKDEGDHSRVQKRMDILERLYQERGLMVEALPLTGASRIHAVFASLLLADWAAVATAAHYGLESEQVPMVEEFKKLIAE
jgi:glucose/mannose-6-phosphate isomerase